MSLIVIGLSHKTAPVELREHLSVGRDKLEGALEKLNNSQALQEVVVLSTCNRIEVYVRPKIAGDHARRAVRNFLTDLYDSPALQDSLYDFEGLAAVKHLFEVSSGLDSLVVGETDILGQVKAAYQVAHQFGTTGKITNVLFQRALFVGKTVRNRTRISEGSSSVGAIAVQLAERIFGQLNQHRILLLGAGKMAEVTARHLLSQKAGQLTILNRTPTKAQELAQLLNGRAGSIADLAVELVKADIVICSTAAEKPLITTSMVESILHERRSGSLYFIDIAVPRNVEAGVHGLDNVYVYNIDDLKTLVDENLGHRREEIGVAASLVETMAQEFFEWLRGAMEGKAQPLRHMLHNG